MSGLKGWTDDMKCKICGGELYFHDYLYICESCHNKFSISLFYEINDVFIAYPETDVHGRRTKESIIAQNIYENLKQKNINTFYQRISTEGKWEEEAEAICDAAAAGAKIIIVVGTNKDCFEIVMNRYKKIIGDKTLIPVYADMNAYDLPHELRNLQALNYENIGSINDLITKIMNLLNRSGELDFNRLENKHKKKIVALVLLFVILLIIGLLYFVFGTEYLLPSKKYRAAEQLLSEGRYTEAIEKFSDISSYKNSYAQLKTIYSQYVGYYWDEESNISLHLDILDNINAQIEIRNNSTNLSITESAEIKNTKSYFYYTDSENNQGTCEIILKDDGIQLNTDTEASPNNSSIGKQSVFFELQSKSDQPLTKYITADIIKRWLSKKYTKREIQREGFDLTVRVSSNAIQWDSYFIENTNVIVDCFRCKISSVFGYENGTEKEQFDEETAIFFTVPAKIIIPDKIGEQGEIIFDGDNLFIPNINYFSWSPPNAFGFCMSQNDISNIIEDDTPVLCTSKELIGEELFDISIKNSSWLFYY